MKTSILVVCLVVCLAVVSYFLSTTGYVVLNENSRMIVNKDYFPQAHMLINDAEKSIHIIMFQIRRYGETETLFNDLIRARNRGIDVKIVIEGGEDYLGTSFYEKQKNACKYLKENGIEIRKDEKGTTTHAKIIIADDTILIGSTNWNYYSFNKNNEANVLITSKNLSDSFEDYFYFLWNNSEEGC